MDDVPGRILLHMLQKSSLSRMPIGAKLALVLAGSIAMTALAVIAASARQRAAFTAPIGEEVSRLINADWDHTAEGVDRPIRAQDKTMRQQVENNLDGDDIWVAQGTDGRVFIQVNHVRRIDTGIRSWLMKAAAAPAMEKQPR